MHQVPSGPRNNEWNKNKEKFSDGKLSTYITVKKHLGFENILTNLRILNRGEL
jgi:hypothetical protein